MLRSVEREAKKIMHILISINDSKMNDKIDGSNKIIAEFVIFIERKKFYDFFCLCKKKEDMGRKWKFSLEIYLHMQK